MRLTPHFTLDELLRNSGADAPPDRVVIAAQRTADVLEAVRRQLGDVPLIITSWYRTPERNASIAGSSATSAHLSGYGVDFIVNGMKPREVIERLRPHVTKLGVDQLIDERDHVHLSADPRARGQVLIEPAEGTYTALPAVTVTADAPKPSAGGNAKLVAILTAVGTIIGALVKILSDGK